jgi:tetratricopeptide (TPR) repeat protein
MYAAAVELKPNEQEARNKLAEIENKLAEIAKEKERTELLDSLTSMADIALANQLLEVAMSNYQQAVTLSTGDESYYLHRQIHYIEQEVVRQDSLARLQQRAKQVDAAVNAYEQGKEALKYLNYEVALANFNLFLNLADSDMFALSEYNLEPMMKFTTAKVHDIEDYLARKNANTAIVDTSRLVRPKNETFTTLLFYPNPKDPGLETVYAKHPEIDFNAPPDDQRFDTIADYSVESKLISREIMSLKPEMNVTDSTSQVKLICQNIEFKGSKVYYKFLVQNYDSTEFLTGKMILTYHRRDGTEIEVLPNYVANFPIILAGRQKVLVYLAKLIPVANDENLTFQMSDRLNRMTLSLSIPGELYNQKQVALSKH